MGGGGGWYWCGERNWHEMKCLERMGRWTGGGQLEVVSCVFETTVGGRVYKALSLKGHSVPYTSYRSQRRVVGVQMPQHSEELRGTVEVLFLLN